MSYNIDTTSILQGSLKIHKDSIDELAEEYHEDETEFAECNFVGEYEDETPDADGYIALEHVWWHGEFSGSSYDKFLSCLEETTGSADILVTWEGGDTIEGLRVVDGVVTECDVGYVLTPREPEE